MPVQKKTKKLPPFDKYEYYTKSVQSPATDAEFFFEQYQSLRKKHPCVLREDFCGTFAISCEWVKLRTTSHAIGIDLDQEPLKYGETHNLSILSDDQRRRITLLQKSVIAADLPPSDIVIAPNFSYFLFKKRAELLNYFTLVKKSLKNDGLFFVDCFGGPRCFEANEEETEHEDEGFSYFWDQHNFNPITHEATFYIHFKRTGEKKRERVFTYDWRLWTIPEIRDLMSDAGFKDSIVLWEGTTKKGTGDGVFSPSEIGEECESWIAYIVGVK